MRSFAQDLPGTKLRERQRMTAVYRSLIMRTRCSPHFCRFIALLALFQTLVPGLASIVDALVERNAVRVVQVGEPGSANFRAAHPDDCALCAAAAAITGPGEQRAPLPSLQLARQTPAEYRTGRRPNVARPIASQRAPPLVLS